MTNKPLFLIVNDDGVHAPGVAALRRAAEKHGDVVTVAPMVEKSGCGQSITLTEPIRLKKIDTDIYAINGSPADCVLFAVNELLDRKPDWVFSGINRGSNLGQDTLYSGTVAGAMEGIIQGIPAMAFSLKGARHFTVEDFSAATEVASYMMQNRELFANEAALSVINVNVPDIPYPSIRGIRTAGLGRRIYESRFYKNTDPRGYEYFWLGGGGDTFAPIAESDCHTVDEGYVSVSFLKPDHNDYQLMQDWKVANQENLDSAFLASKKEG